MSEILYPTSEETLELQERLIDEFGGTHGVRDLGLLDSALHRPQSGYYTTIYEQAAALMQSLALNHAFVDGNKRVAMALPLIFLRMNGVRLQVSADDGEEFLIRQIIKDKIQIADIASWLERHK